MMVIYNFPDMAVFWNKYGTTKALKWTKHTTEQLHYAPMQCLLYPLQSRWVFSFSIQVLIKCLLPPENTVGVLYVLYIGVIIMQIISRVCTKWMENVSPVKHSGNIVFISIHYSQIPFNAHISHMYAWWITQCFRKSGICYCFLFCFVLLRGGEFRKVLT